MTYHASSKRPTQNWNEIELLSEFSHILKAGPLEELLQSIWRRTFHAASEIPHFASKAPTGMSSIKALYSTWAMKSFSDATYKKRAFLKQVAKT